MVKNAFKVLMAVIFITINFLIGVDSQDETVLCEIDFLNKPATKMTMQCRQKRYGVFFYLHCIFTIILCFHVLFNICSFVWAFSAIGERRITALISDLRYTIYITKASKKILGLMDMENGRSTLSFKIKSPLLESKGDDFLFLFDLIARTS
jgi:hypothetical protein